MASSSSSSSITKLCKYDVFLSFRGVDTRDNFASYLYAALSQNQIETFIDYQLERGDDISQALMKAMEESMISIVIFSKDYAFSKWCLDELVKILDCKEKNGQIVIPVFYNIDPSHVRHQKGRFEKAFVEHETCSKTTTERVQRWRTALTKASNLSGWDSSKTRPDSTLVKEIVKDILKKLNAVSPSSDSKDHVGLTSHIEEIKSLLCIGSSDFRKIGIWGMGGIGKTTIAGTVFNQISSYFEGCCFLANVREESERDKIRLRNKFLLEILKDENLPIETPELPLILKNRLQRKKVLIVLDDVSSFRELEFLFGGFDQFSQGSRIIITTRDRQVLSAYGVTNLYEVVELNNHEALQLFCKHAFRQNTPLEDFMELSERLVGHIKGNPLALKVLGSSLYGKSNKDWEDTLKKLKRISIPEIHEVLKSTYDGLDDEVKSIFLDIACFFKGWDRDYVTEVLKGCYIGPHAGLNVLVDKSLITISLNELQMHDLVQEMGREIVRQESVKDPGKRSRLWNHEEIHRVLKNNRGTDTVEGIFLDLSKTPNIHLSPKSFINMPYLRFLKIFVPDFVDISKVHFPDGLEYLSNELRYLHWDRYPWKSLPPDFSPENLVALDLCYSNVEQLWEGTKEALELKSMDLSHSQKLTEIPDLSVLEHVEDLKLAYCTRLLEIPPSIGFLNNLTSLSLEGCESLISFPRNIHFGSLIKLDLSNCISLSEFPQISGNIEVLLATGTAIEEVPSSIECLTKLSWFALANCTRLKNLPDSICKLKSLDLLDLSGCSKLESLPELVDKMERLSILIGQSALSCCRNRGPLPSSSNLEPLPSSIFKLKSLDSISLKGFSKSKCFPETLEKMESSVELNLSETAIKELPTWIEHQSLPELPLHLRHLEANNCQYLRSLPELPLCLEQSDAIKLEIVTEWFIGHSWNCLSPMFVNCPKLNHNAYNNPLGASQLRIQHLATEALRRTYDQVEGKVISSICLSGSEIPNWFSHQNSGSSVTIKLPRPFFNSMFIGFALCAVVAVEEYSHEYSSSWLSVSYDGHFETDCADMFDCSSSVFTFPKDYKITVGSDHMLVCYDPCLNIKLLKGDYTTASFKFCLEDEDRKPIEFCKVKCCGVCPLYAQSNITEADISIDATNQDSGQTMVEESTKIWKSHDDYCYHDEANSYGIGSGKFDEEELEPHPKRICRKKINC